MSYTYTDHVANGSQVTFPFRFAGRDKAYISAADVQVGFVEAGTWLPATGWTLSGTNQITFLTPPTEGKQIRIRRIVDKINPYAYFERGNVLDINSLNSSFIKNLQVSQEILDGFFPEGFYFKTDLDMGGHKIINLHEGSESGDAVNYDQFKELSDRVNEIESDLTGLSHRTVPMYYIATGGESRWEIGHWTFDAAILFINGIFQNQNLGAFTISNNGFNFAEPLQKGDEVYALVGSKLAAPDEHVTISDLKDPDSAWRLIGRKYPYVSDGVFMSKVVHDVDYSNLFSGASTMSQGFCIVDTPSGARMFFHQTIGGTNKVRFVETTFNPNGVNENPSVISYSQELDNIGHQSVYAVYEGGKVFLYTPCADEKSYYRIEWKGNATSNADLKKVTVFEEGFYQAEKIVTLGASFDGKILLLQTAGEDYVAFYNQAAVRVVYMFDREALDRGEKGFIRKFEVEIPPATTMAFQGCLCDDNYFYVYYGHTGVLTSHKLGVYTLSGEMVRAIPLDSVRVKYGKERMYGDETLGYPVLQEPEGLAWYRGKLYLMCMDFWYKNASVVTFAGKTFAARRTSAFSGKSPLNPTHWTPTNLIPASGAPEYNKDARYVCSNATKLSKAVVTLEINDGTGYPAYSDISLPDSHASVFMSSNGVNLAIGPNEDFQFGVYHQNIQSHKPLIEVRKESPNTDSSAAVWRLFGDAFEDAVPTGRFVQIKHRLNPTQDIMELRSGRSLHEGGGINLYNMLDPSAPGRTRLYCTDGTGLYSLLLSPVTPSFHSDQDALWNLGTRVNRWKDIYGQNIILKSDDEKQKALSIETTKKKGSFQISTSGNLGIWDDTASRYVIATRPDGTGFMQTQFGIKGDFFPDANTFNLGLSNKAWANAYFQNAPTIVSDARLKTPARELTDAEAKAFLEISKLAAVWQWLDKVEEEGEDARIHAGCTVQAAIAVMEKYGLDWTKYSAFCYDKWDAKEAVYDIVDGKSVLVEEAVEAGDRYRLRREELLWWCMKAQNVWIDSIEGRLSQLEEKLKEV